MEEQSESFIFDQGLTTGDSGETSLAKESSNIGLIKFDRSMAMARWIGRFEAWASFKGITENKEKLVSLLKLILPDEILQVIEQEAAQTYDEFKATLLTLDMKLGPVEEAYRELKRATKGSEKWSEFVRCNFVRARIAYADKESALRETKEVVLSQLDDTSKRDLGALFEDWTLEKIARELERRESLDREMTRKRSIPAGVKAIPVNSTSDNVGKKNGQFHCYFCQGPNHLARDCIANPNRSNRGKGRGKAPQSREGQVNMTSVPAQENCRAQEQNLDLNE